MTELEWERCIDLRPMLEFLRERISGRKLQLFAVACCRQHWDLFCPQPSRQIVNSAERFADGIDTEAELDALIERPFGPLPAGVALNTARDTFSAARYTAWCRNADVWHHAADAAECVRDAVSAHHGLREYQSSTAEVFREPVTVFEQFVEDWRDYWEEREYVSDPHPEQHRQVALLHDIVGNPFRRVEIDPTWLTGDVLGLARRVYHSRDFGVMPILADALQEAGCEHEGVLSHCRDERATHVRGCWVVDLILGKV
jgi:hypothetical protein